MRSGWTRLASMQPAIAPACGLTESGRLSCSISMDPIPARSADKNLADGKLPPSCSASVASRPPENRGLPSRGWRAPPASWRRTRPSARCGRRGRSRRCPRSRRRRHHPPQLHGCAPPPAAQRTKFLFLSTVPLCPVDKVIVSVLLFARTTRQHRLLATPPSMLMRESR